MKTYKFYSDPGHGWAVVKRAELVKLGIADKISSYSYQRGDSVYLEEDADATLFFETLRARGIEFKLTGKSGNRQSRIRNYEAYSA